MNTILQIICIAAVFIITIIAYSSFGPKNKSLIFSKNERPDWNNFIQSRLGKWFTLTNIVGTLTSLATVYLFFIGSAKIFGGAIFICSIALIIGAPITNMITKSILKREEFQHLLIESPNTFGVIAKLFWVKEDKKAINVARLVKLISMLNIIGVIWLEFALFSDIFSQVIGIDNLITKAIIVLLTAWLVVYFTVKYGLRGFVFADFFQSPLILLSVIVLLIGSAILFFNSNMHLSDAKFFSPMVSTGQCILFGLHVLFLNTFLVLVTEGHWLRLWIFGKNEIKYQSISIGATTVLWILLSLVGIFTYPLVEAVGNDAIPKLLTILGNYSILFPMVFWIGGTAALFSTSDMQVYSLLLVNSWNTKSGELSEKKSSNLNPIKISFLISISFAVAYYLTRILHMPFEKIIFIIIPMSLNVLPAIVRLVRKLPPKPILIILSLAIYLLFAAYGFIKPDMEMTMTLAASLVPIFFSIVSLKK